MYETCGIKSYLTIETCHNIIFQISEIFDLVLVFWICKVCCF